MSEISLNGNKSKVDKGGPIDCLLFIDPDTTGLVDTIAQYVIDNVFIVMKEFVTQDSRAFSTIDQL
jgi:hypothetical protein